MEPHPNYTYHRSTVYGLVETLAWQNSNTYKAIKRHSLNWMTLSQFETVYNDLINENKIEVKDSRIVYIGRDTYLF